MSELFNLTRMARAIGVTQAWLRAEADGGRIPTLKAGNRYLFNPDAVRANLAERAAHLLTAENSRLREIEPSALVVTRINLEKCIESCERCEDYDNPVERCSSFAMLKTSLVHLWNVRHQQNTEFAQLVNCIQMVITGLDYENFSVNEIAVLRSGFQCMLDADGRIDGTLVKTVIGEFCAGGLDVFRELGWITAGTRTV